jgi:drug/metabolite transporter (DMT)-like permease
MTSLVLASLLWAASFSIIKVSIQHCPPLMLAALRLMLSFLLFAPFLKKGKDLLPWRPVLIGVIQFGLMYSLYIESFRFLPAHTVALSTLTTPVWVVLWDSLFKQKLSKSALLAALMATLGAGLLVPFSSESAPVLKGLLLMQAANASFALGQILQSRWGRTIPVHQHMAFAFAGGAAVPLALLLLGEGSLTWPSLPWNQWMWVLYLGLVPSGLGFTLWNHGITQVTAATAAVMNNLKIPLAVFMAFLFLGERPSWPRLAGACLCFALALLLCQEKAGLAKRI